MPFLERLLRKYQRTAAEYLARRPYVLRNDRPIISFTFDDFPTTALTTAGTILEQHGVRGTYYISLGLTGQIAPTGPIIERSQVSSVLERGHELGCHTFAHCHASDTPSDIFETNIVENRRVLAELVPGAELKTLSYPIGCPKPATKRSCAKHFAACRAGGQTFNRGIVDLDNLRAFFLEQSRDDLNAVKQMIDATVSARGWLILATHDVCPNPTRYGCTPEFFERAVRYSVDSGSTVVPVTGALELCGLVVGKRKSEDGSQKTEDGRPRTEGGEPESDVRRPMSDVRPPTSDLRPPSSALRPLT